MLSAVANGFSQDIQRISLANPVASVTIEAATLEVSMAVGKNSVKISAPQKGLGRVTEVKQSTNQMSWKLPDMGVSVIVQLDGEKLSLDFRAEKAGSFTWPVIEPEPAIKGWILPMFEGVYAPVDHAKWIAFLEKQGPLTTTAELGMPFWGLDHGDFTVTWIATNPFNNEMTFAGREGRLGAAFKHEFTRNNAVKEFGFVVRVGKASPIEPAKVYRAWLQGRGEFVSMAEKIKRTPEAAKLPGAAHVYLWGDEILGADDVTDWKGFGKQLTAEGRSTNASVGKYVWAAMKPEVQKVVAGLEKAQWVDRYMKSQVTEELGRLLVRTDFGGGEKLSGDLSEADVCRRNCQRLAEAFPRMFAKPEDWGDGVSTKMISRLGVAGFDRLWLGTSGWEGLVRRPEIVTAAKQRGFLIGTYDSYHSIHAPKTVDTWATAQFDQQLFDTGGIVQANGKKKAGFQKKGFVLSPIAARPYVEKRVGGLMEIFHANSWFMDCDGFGEFFDDYAEAHPATQLTDMQARCARMAWIRDTYGVVMGSEGCAAGVASTIHFTHGVMTPVIGWGDPDLTNKTSTYFLGAYYPPNRPTVFFKSVPTKEEYRYIFFDPRFRLPLFETVFHDSVVATHHWSAPSLKFSDQAATVELLELLYNVPPLYHLNLEELAKRKAQMKRHYNFFSPLHRETALLPLTEFEWTPDRSVQRTRFGDKIEMIANFGDEDCAVIIKGKSPSDLTDILSPAEEARIAKKGAKDQSFKLPPRTILARHRDSGKILIFTPQESK